MVAHSRGAIHLWPLFESYRHAIAPGQANNLFQPVAMPPSCNKHGLHRPPGSERFPHSVNTGQFFHR
jgi:hypothetical protein